MTTKHIYIYKNKRTQEVFADLFAKDLLEGVTTFPRIDNAKPFSLRENPNQHLLQHCYKHVLWD